MGRLVRNPEVRYSSEPDPIAVARYTLAVNRRFKRQGEQDADFIQCVAFGKAGEFAEKYFKKGQMVSVIGRLQVRKWDDHGTARWSTDVVVEEQYFAESKTSYESRGAAGEHKPAVAGNIPSADEVDETLQRNAGSGRQLDLSDSDGFYPIDDSIEDDDFPF